MLGFYFLFYFVFKQNDANSDTILPFYRMRRAKCTSCTSAGPISGFSQLFIVAPTETFVLDGWSEMSSGPTTMPPGGMHGGPPDRITDFQTN